jgi:uncharacterized protein YacL
VRRVHYAVHKAVSTVPVEDLVMDIGGLVVGLVVAALLSYPLSLLPSWFGHVFPAVAAILCAYIGISLTRTHRRELMNFFRHENRRELPSQPVRQPAAWLTPAPLSTDG